MKNRLKAWGGFLFDFNPLISNRPHDFMHNPHQLIHHKGKEVMEDVQFL